MVLALVSLLFAGALATQDAAPVDEQRIGRPEIEAPPPAKRRRTVTVVRALDKITARITELELPADEEVPFGSLVITARYCYSRPPEEPPETFAFLQIDEIRDGERKRLFSGWMLASSPALHGLEHPVYDVWVIGCKAAAPESEPGKR